MIGDHLFATVKSYVIAGHALKVSRQGYILSASQVTGGHFGFRKYKVTGDHPMSLPRVS